jgi:cytolysin (calcineurin-like family phosphatase)
MSHGQAHDLTVSLLAVNHARSTLDLARAQGSVSGLAAPEQRRLLAALEGYAVALTRQGRPVPYRMRTELAMYRSLFDPDLRRRGHGGPER